MGLRCLVQQPLELQAWAPKAARRTIRSQRSVARAGDLARLAEILHRAPDQGYGATSCRVTEAAASCALSDRPNRNLKRFLLRFSGLIQCESVVRRIFQCGAEATYR
jgi:hypothetical protein